MVVVLDGEVSVPVGPVKVTVEGNSKEPDFF